MSSVRPAQSQDAAMMVALIRELAEYEELLHECQAEEDSLRAALFSETPAVFAHVVEHDTEHGREVVGFALWLLSYSTWLGTHGIYLEDLYVKPEFRGFGYGKALLQELARTCTQRGYGRFEWSVLDWNEPSIGFYKNLGAVPMDGWTMFRLTGDALKRLGTS